MLRTYWDVEFRNHNFEGKERDITMIFGDAISSYNLSDECVYRTTTMNLSFLHSYEQQRPWLVLWHLIICRLPSGPGTLEYLRLSPGIYPMEFAGISSSCWSFSGGAWGSECDIKHLIGNHWKFTSVEGQFLEGSKKCQTDIPNINAKSFID